MESEEGKVREHKAYLVVIDGSKVHEHKEYLVVGGGVVESQRGLQHGEQVAEHSHNYL